MSDLRYEIVEVPANIKQCSGIQIYGRRIKSVIFTTDVSIIANNNADAVLAVYPFTPNPAILKSIMQVASVPVFAGVGGADWQRETVPPIWAFLRSPKGPLQ